MFLFLKNGWKIKRFKNIKNVTRIKNAKKRFYIYVMTMETDGKTDRRRDRGQGLMSLESRYGWI